MDTDNLPAVQDDRALAPLPSNPLKRDDLTEAEQEVIYDYFQKLRYGPVATSALRCKQMQCKYYSQCPLGMINKLPPINAPCPLEEGLINQWTADLVKALGITGDDAIDQAQVCSLVALKLFDKRAMDQLSGEDMVIQVFRSMAIDGTAIYEPRLHPLFSMMRENHKSQDKLLESLLGTREAQSRAHARKAHVIEATTSAIDKVKQALGKRKMGAFEEAGAIECEVVNKPVAEEVPGLDHSGEEY